ncbi:MAG: MFS transporter [Ruminococcaceae bacterium]|nr:MFS transporter [Oscillospiraceae bacterium]
MEAEQKPKKRFYFGWWIVVVGFLIMALSFAPSQSLPGLFVKPLAEEFGVSRTVSASVQSTVTLSLMLASLFVGRIINRFSIKWVVAAALALLAVCNFIIASSSSFALMYVAGVGRGIAVTFGTTLPAANLINNWFGAKMRGRVWGVTAVGSGVGAMVLTPIVGALMDNFGWRSAFIFFGILSVAMIPLVILTYVRHPGDKGFEQIGRPDPTPGGLRPDDTGISMRTAVRSKVWWLVLPAAFLLAGSTQIWNMNGAAYLTDLGYNIVFVSFLITLCSIGLTVGKVAQGAISDRFGTRTGMLAGTGLCVVGYLLVLLAGNQVFAYISMVLLGFGLGAPTVMTPLVVRDLFGNKNFGTLSGLAQAAGACGAGTLSLLGAYTYDVTGSYTISWVMACVFGISTVALVFIAYRLRHTLTRRQTDSEETTALPGKEKSRLAR